MEHSRPVAPATDAFPAPERSDALHGLRRLLAFTAGDRRSIAVIVSVTIAIGAMGAAEPLLFKSIIDALAARRFGRALAMGVAALLALSLLREALGGFSNWLTWRTRLRVQHRLLDATVDRLHTLSMSYHRTQSVGSLLTRLDRGVQGVVAALSEVAFGVLPALAFLALSAALMVRLDWRLALVVFACVPLPALVGAYAAPVQTRRERKLLERWTRIYARFNEVLSGIITVKSFAMEHEEKQRFIRQVDEANRLVVRGVGFDTRMSAAQNLLVALTRVILIGYGAILVTRGQVTVGTLVAFLTYLGGLFGPVQGLTGAYQTLRRAAVSMDTVLGILDAEEEVSDEPGAAEAHPLRGDVELENVWFSYQASTGTLKGSPYPPAMDFAGRSPAPSTRPDRFVLRGINLLVPAGQMVALVGPSGAGKTSIAVLLQRLYDPQEGAIRIDGVDLRRMTQRSLRKQIGVVLQDASLFNDTIRANICYGRPDASTADIEAAARAANAHDFILSLPGGYEYEVGERGSLLSAGQRQRIAIARALLRDPPLIILDEATSALDAESESLVQEALGRLLAGRTTLVIAHRLSTIVKADRIVVLRAGRVVEEGTHDELMTAGGQYAQLVKLQTRALTASRRDAAEPAPAAPPAPPSDAAAG